MTGNMKRLSTEGAPRRKQQHMGTIVGWRSFLCYVHRRREKGRGQVGRWMAGCGYVWVNGMTGRVAVGTLERGQGRIDLK